MRKTILMNRNNFILQIFCYKILFYNDFILQITFFMILFYKIFLQWMILKKKLTIRFGFFNKNCLLLFEKNCLLLFIIKIIYFYELKLKSNVTIIFEIYGTL